MVELHKTSHGLKVPAEEPRILDAVIDQTGEHFVRFGSTTASIWFSLAEFQQQETAVLSRLAGIGIRHFVPSKKAALRETLDLHSDFRKGVVASQPGWTGRHYIFGDGSVLSPDGAAEVVIITFAGDSRFTPVGKLADWRRAVGPIVGGQPLAFFAIVYALVGAILKFAPNGVNNPQVELVGEPESGKTSLAKLAASVWAGDPDSDVGGAETWDFTLAAFDDLRSKYADAFLAIDEQNLAGASVKELRDFVQRLVFKAAKTGSRKRFTDTSDAPNVRLALMSTSNTPLRKHLPPSAVSNAMQTRMATIEIARDNPLGVFRAVPEGFASSRAAIDELRQAADKYYGTLAREFVRHLVNENPQAVSRQILTCIQRFNRRLDRKFPKRSGRISDTFALTYAAGVLARRWRLLPKRFGSLGPTIMEVFEMTQDPETAKSPYPFNVVQAFIDRNTKAIVLVDRMKAPLDRATFEKSACFVQNHHGRKEFLIPSVVFRREFPDYRALLKAFRLEGHTRSEIGKLTIKTPTKICHEGRVYVILARQT